MMNSDDASHIAGALLIARNAIQWDAHSTRLNDHERYALASFLANIDDVIADAEKGASGLKGRIEAILLLLVIGVAANKELMELVNDHWDELAWKGVIDERPAAAAASRADALAIVRRALTHAITSDYAQAMPVDRYADEIADWQPDPGHCHDQVAAWLCLHPEDAALRGWVTWYGMGDTMRFASHSLVRTAAGEVVDVTEPRKTRYRFIEHPADAGDFLSLVLGVPPTPWVDVDASPWADHRGCS
ncbi:hypothetical protein [Burkholderia gladioli]|uniref:hypothetical protein n=1 Tax=Burkholderia gladioli TaxID=28095 RepID=UPI00163ED924|nr:hypothetical protein [Burkholderia gladioli]